MKDNSIKVSVIIITYNQENYIMQALDSVLSQKVNFSFEVLVGDDASDDRTSEIIKEYQQKFPDIILPVLRAENMGAARNAYELCKMARGDYLAFCEGDDYWLSNDKLQMQIDFLDSHEDFIGCYNICDIVDKNRNSVRFQRIRWVKYKNRFRFEDFEGGLFLPGQSSSIVKRNIFKDKNRDLTVLYLFDKDISDRISNMIYLLEGDFHCIKRRLSAYRIDKDSKEGLTNRKFKNNAEKMLLDLEMTHFLENYVSKKVGATLFTKKRCQILAKSVILFLLKPCGKNLNIINTVYYDTGTPWYAFFYTPVFVLERLFWDGWYTVKGYVGYSQKTD